MEVSILQHAKDKAPQRLTIDEVADRLVGNEAESGEPDRCARCFLCFARTRELLKTKNRHSCARKG